MKWKGLFILMASFCMAAAALAQAPYAKGSSVKDVPLQKVLNHTTSVSSLRSLGGTLTIVDFFGTWCMPCLRALPHLSELQSAFNDEVRVVLVSNETELQLENFLKKRNNIAFPVVVDADNRLTDLFQPPSLPYTVVLDKAGTVIAVTEAAALTKEALQNWLSQSRAGIAVVKQEAPRQTTNPPAMNQKSSNAVVQLSQEFIYSAKTGENTTALKEELKKLSLAGLQQHLATDAAKKAFWINLYNGYTQEALKENAEQYKNRRAFFRNKRVQVAGRHLSLDDLEHGILRRSKIKWSLGHVNKLFPPRWEKSLRVQKVDHRIHFALNCGAKSCPPIAFYKPETLDQQLDMAASAYLTSEAAYEDLKKLVTLPAILSWFRADFGGKQGMKQLLRKHKIIPEHADPTIRFKKYDWSLMLNNYTTEIQ
jgi:thiol-disulfide isomerase/thioredoxin